ncbi:putative F-box protein [Sesamum alatum]|uniref:F-box protein n=1 Tax=Sesamum alatum TaxID=300844 RepID=A0AAE1XP08_9LAMI|nr:putative F-box protein [Sesamum alatum]
MNCKRSSSASSAARVAGNHDILREIFLILPAKSLIRFQSVSRHWQSLIFDDPSFLHSHTLHHSCRRRRCSEHQPSFLLRDSVTSQFFILNPTTKNLVPFRLRFPYLRILQSCNGLLLLECKNSPHGQKDYYICNPATMQSKKLLPDSGKFMTSFAGLFLVFDPSKSHHYKVIGLTRSGNRHGLCRGEDSEYKVEVYDSKTRTWKYQGKRSITYRPFCNGIYWKDGIYFVRPRGHSFFFYLDQDRENDRWIYEPPRIRSPGAKRNYIVESNGHMYCVMLNLYPNKNFCLVFEMDCNDYYIWSKKYHVDLNPISASFAENKGTDIGLLGMIRGDKEEYTLVISRAWQDNGLQVS